MRASPNHYVTDGRFQPAHRSDYLTLRKRDGDVSYGSAMLDDSMAPTLLKGHRIEFFPVRDLTENSIVAFRLRNYPRSLLVRRFYWYPRNDCLGVFEADNPAWPTAILRIGQDVEVLGVVQMYRRLLA